MARLHAVALGPNLAERLAKIAPLLASATLVASCATAPWAPGSSEQRLSNRRVIYLETSEFRWVDPREREELACANGMPVVCTTGHGRLSLANCGCLPPD